MTAGKNFDMKLAGAYAVDSLRLEKGYSYWGHELDTETTPLEAGLGFAVDMSKVNIAYYKYVIGIFGRPIYL